MLAALFGFAKAAFLGFMGIIGLVSWDDVTEPWGIGALVFAALFGIAALAVAGGLLALLYVFVGPTSAILPSLFTALLAAVLIWLLYGPRAAQEYFAA
jgi:hypothetical protein